MKARKFADDEDVIYTGTHFLILCGIFLISVLGLPKNRNPRNPRNPQNLRNPYA